MRFEETQLGRNILMASFKVANRRLVMRKNALTFRGNNNKNTNTDYVSIDRLRITQYSEIFPADDIGKIIELLEAKPARRSKVPSTQCDTTLDYLLFGLQFRYKWFEEFSLCSKLEEINHVDEALCLYRIIRDYLMQNVSVVKRILRSHHLIGEKYQKKLLRILSSHEYVSEENLLYKLGKTFPTRDSLRPKPGTAMKLILVALELARKRRNHFISNGYISSYLVRHLIITNWNLADGREIYFITALEIELFLTSGEGEQLLEIYDDTPLKIQIEIEHSLGSAVAILPYQQINATVYTIEIDDGKSNTNCELIVIYDAATKAVLAAEYMTGDINELFSFIKSVIVTSNKHIPKRIVYDTLLAPYVDKFKQKLLFLGVKFEKRDSENHLLANFLKYFTCKGNVFRTIKVRSVVGNKIQLSLLQGGAEDGLEILRKEIFYSFNASNRYKDLGMVSPQEALKEFQPSSLCRLTDEQFAMIFFDRSTARVSARIAYVEQGLEVLMYKVEVGEGITDGTYRILIDFSDTKNDIFISYASRLVNGKFDRKYLRDQEEPIAFLPTLINVREEANMLLRAELGIKPKEKSPFNLDNSRWIRKARYQLNQGHDRIYHNQSNRI